MLEISITTLMAENGIKIRKQKYLYNFYQIAMFTQICQGLVKEEKSKTNKAINILSIKFTNIISLKLKTIVLT